MIKLREDYQLPLVVAIRQAYKDGYRAPLVVLPTGGGKTTIFGYVTSSAASKGRCIYLLAHRAELVKQISMTLARFGTVHNVVAPTAIVRQAKIEQFRQLGRSFVGKSRVYVCSAQTLVKRLGDITDKPDIIVVDESHHLTDGSTWGKICAAFPDAKLLPVTATPCRLDGKGLGKDAGGFADTLIMGPTMRWLIDNGYLSDYRAFAPPMRLDLKGVKTRMGDYAKDQMAEAMDKPTITGDAVEHYLRLARGKRAVAFCASVAHAEHVADAFNAAGVPASVLDGSLDPAERDRRIKAFESGEILVLTSCDVVSEGFDLPAIEVAILLRPTKSLALYLQQVGRALRIFAGKEYAIILDHVGAIATHGLPDEDRDWSLDGVTKKRRSANDNGPDVNITTCPMCFSIHMRAPECPTCGHKYKMAAGGRTGPKQEDGELVELTAAAKENLRRQAEAEKMKARKQRISQEHQCQTLEDLIQLGKDRGYSFPRQWAERRWEFISRRKTG